MPHSTPSAPCVKTCTKCEKTKPATIEYFYASKAGKHGLHSACKICHKAQVLARNALHPDIKRERDRKRRVVNSERLGEIRRARYAANVDRERERSRKWAAANPEKVRTRNRRRRAAGRQADGNHSAEDIERQYKCQKGICYYCRVRVGNEYHVDHIVPLSRGGSNSPENLVITCPKCNMEKHNKLPHEWSQGGRLL